MDITFTLEVTGDESLLDTFAHQQMMDAASAIRDGLESNDIPKAEVRISFFGDGILDAF